MATLKFGDNSYTNNLPPTDS